MIHITEDPTSTFSEKIEFLFEKSTSEHDLSTVPSLASQPWGSTAHQDITIRLCHLLVKELLYVDTSFYITQGLHHIQTIDKVSSLITTKYYYVM